MMIFGEISGQQGESFVNGDSFAKEMIFLSEYGFKNIRISINSIGGSIRQGMSIINAMNIARMNGASIETYIVGVADSMAGMISAFGDKGKRVIANFGSGIIHEPLVMNKAGEIVTIDKIEDGVLKSELLAMKETLMILMSSSTGKEKDSISATMKEGKRLNASEMKSFGMVDSILELSNEPIETENISALELMVACSKVNIKNNTNTNTMKKVNEILNLSQDASEGSVATAVEAMVNKIADHKSEIDAKDATILKHEGTIEALENTAKETADKNAESYVDALINAGKLKKENRESLVNSAKENFAGFKTLTESLEVTFVDVTEEIEKNPSTDKNEVLATEFFNLRQDSQAYEAMKNENPSKFNKLEEAFLNSSTDFDSVQ